MRRNQLAAHSMAVTVQFQLNSRAKPSVPTAKANKLLQHRRGTWKEGEPPVRKHHTQLGCVKKASTGWKEGGAATLGVRNVKFLAPTVEII